MDTKIFSNAEQAAINLHEASMLAPVPLADHMLFAKSKQTLLDFIAEAKAAALKLATDKAGAA